METRIFGPTGVAVPIIGQGTWKVRDTAEAVAALVRGIELGMTHIDTAELYTGAEEVVAQAMSGRRDKVFLVSKVLPGHASRRGTVSACEQSLRRLGTDYLDLYLLHWDGGEHGIADTMAGMRDLVLAGKIRAAGVSNFDRSQMRAAKTALGSVPLACNQVLYHLGDRDIEEDVLPWCEANSVALVGYSPFAGLGALAEGTPRGDTLKQIADRHGRTVRQVVLRFLTRRPSLFAIPKASQVAHVEENAGGQGFELSPRDVAEIEAAFPR